MGQYLNRGKRSFSEREKRVYSAVLGYGAAKQGKFFKCETVKEKHSFLNGFNSVKRGKKQ